MRARYMILSLLIILCILTPVQAYTGHNLEWGVETGVKYFYQANHYEVTDGDLDGDIDEEIDISLRYYGMIEEPYPLPVDENITTLVDVWGFAVPYLENGTADSTYPFVVVPIGNWSLLSLLLPDFIDSFWFGESADCVFIDNETTWGYRYENPSPQYLSNIYHIEFSKEDGIMSYFYVEYFRSSWVSNRTMECRRITPSLLTLEDVILFGGIIGALAIVIVALVIINKHRGT